MHSTAIPSRAILGDRALFPDLQPDAYVAYAAIAPPSQPVVEAGRSILQTLAAQGRCGFGACLEVRTELREQLGSLIHASGEDVGFVQNTSMALAAVTTALQLSKGDRVVVFSGEYPSNVLPFVVAAQRASAHVVTVQCEAFRLHEATALSELEKCLDCATGPKAGPVKVLALSAVQFQTGLRMPLAAIGRMCRERDVLFVVDGVQALGMVDVDVERDCIDVLACGAHKWLMGVSGLGFLYVCPEAMDRLSPMLVGAMSSPRTLAMLGGEPGNLVDGGELLKSAQVFEGGMLSDIAVAALNESVALIRQLGVPQIFAHVQAYHDLIEPELVGLGFESLRSSEIKKRSGTLALKPPTGVHAGELVALMERAGVAASSPDALLRIAPHWPNALTEVPQVVRSVREALRSLSH